MGGCVRDILLGRTPKDYDIATNASPDGVMRLFPGSGIVGAQFGVVLVREGPWQVEVATYRADGEYSDGRRPDSVLFVGDARHDVERRDFTINALLMDPRSKQVIDYVGGRADLEAGVIRAIGDPLQRFEEDHLRLLRAVRFAARFGFTIEPVTFQAIQVAGALVQVVAPERVRDEITRILMEGGAASGLALLGDTGLAAKLGFSITEKTIDRFRRGTPSTVAMAWAALLLDAGASPARTLLRRYRLSNPQARTATTLIASHGRLNRPFRDEAERKRFARQPSFAEQIELHRMDGLPDPALPDYSEAELHPAPLLTGQDLLAAHLPPGPAYSAILEEAEDLQLKGELTGREEALDWLLRRSEQGKANGE